MPWTEEQIAEAEELLRSGEIDDPSVAEQLRVRLQQERTHRSSDPGSQAIPPGGTVDDLSDLAVTTDEDIATLREREEMEKALREQIFSNPKLRDRLAAKTRDAQQRYAAFMFQPGMTGGRYRPEDVSPYSVMDLDDLRTLSALGDQAADKEISQRETMGTMAGLAAGLLGGAAAGAVLPTMSPVLAAIVSGGAGGATGGATESLVLGKRPKDVALDAAQGALIGGAAGGAIAGPGAGLLKRGARAYRKFLRTTGEGGSEDAYTFLQATEPERFVPGAQIGAGAKTSVRHGLTRPRSAEGSPAGDQLADDVIRQRAPKILRRVAEEQDRLGKEAADAAEEVANSPVVVSTVDEILSIVDDIAEANTSPKTGKPFSPELAARLHKIREIYEVEGVPGDADRRVTAGVIDKTIDAVDDMLNWAAENAKSSTAQLKGLRRHLDRIRSRIEEIKKSKEKVSAAISEQESTESAFGVRRYFPNVEQAMASRDALESVVKQLRKLGTKELPLTDKWVQGFVARNPDLADDIADIVAANAYEKLAPTVKGASHVYMTPGTAQPIRGVLSRGTGWLRYRLDPVAEFLEGINAARVGQKASAGGVLPVDSGGPLTFDMLRAMYRELLVPQGNDGASVAR